MPLLTQLTDVNFEFEFEFDRLFASCLAKIACDSSAYSFTKILINEY